MNSTSSQFALWSIAGSQKNQGVSQKRLAPFSLCMLSCPHPAPTFFFKQLPIFKCLPKNQRNDVGRTFCDAIKLFGRPADPGSGRLLLFGQVPDKAEAVRSGQTADGPAAVDIHQHLPVAVEKEAGGVQKALFPMIKGAGVAGELSGVDAPADGETQRLLIHQSAGILAAVDGEGQQAGVVGGELVERLLVVSQLLTTERSPLPPVNQQHPPPAAQVLGQLQLAVVECGEGHGGEGIPGIEYPVLLSGHLSLLSRRQSTGVSQKSISLLSHSQKRIGWLNS